MRIILTILFLIFFVNTEAQIINARPVYRGVAAAGGCGTCPDTLAKFVFGLSGHSVSGWTAIVGDPNSGVRSGTSNGISVSTIATGDTYWNDGGIGTAAGLVSETTANLMFPGATGSGWFFHTSTTAPSGGNMEISGLTVGYTYKIYVRVNRTDASDNRLSKLAMIDNGGTETINSINAAPSSSSSGANFNQVTSGGTVVWFENKTPDSNGKIFLQVSAYTGWTYGYINSLLIIRTA